MSATLAFVFVLILCALIFDYINGFHDAANSIATVVSTRVLSPGLAVVWAAFFNFVAFLIFKTAVAKNIAKGVDPSVVTLTVVGAALVGAIIWDLLTWWWSLPTSSSHALLGGFAGAPRRSGCHRTEARHTVTPCLLCYLPRMTRPSPNRCPALCSGRATRS